MAYNDYCYAKSGMQVGEQPGNYNGVSALCAQSAEKYLKALLEISFADGALECLRLTEDLQHKIYSLLTQEENKKLLQKEAMQKLDSFDI